MILKQPELGSNPPNKSGQEWGATLSFSLSNYMLLELKNGKLNKDLRIKVKFDTMRM